MQPAPVSGLRPVLKGTLFGAGDYECDGCPKAERPFNCHAIDNVTLEADGSLSSSSPVTQARHARTPERHTPPWQGGARLPVKPVHACLRFPGCNDDMRKVVCAGERGMPCACPVRSQGRTARVGDCGGRLAEQDRAAGHARVRHPRDGHVERQRDAVELPLQLQGARRRRAHHRLICARGPAGPRDTGGGAPGVSARARVVEGLESRPAARCSIGLVWCQPLRLLSGVQLRSSGGTWRMSTAPPPPCFQCPWSLPLQAAKGEVHAADQAPNERLLCQAGDHCFLPDTVMGRKMLRGGPDAAPRVAGRRGLHAQLPPVRVPGLDLRPGRRAAQEPAPPAGAAAQHHRARARACARGCGRGRGRGRGPAKRPGAGGPGAGRDAAPAPGQQPGRRRRRRARGAHTQR